MDYAVKKVLSSELKRLEADTVAQLLKLPSVIPILHMSFLSIQPAPLFVPAS